MVIIVIIITDLQQQTLFPATLAGQRWTLLIKCSKCRFSHLTSHVKDARLVHIHNTIIQGVECVDTLQEVIQIQWKVQRCVAYWRHSSIRYIAWDKERIHERSELNVCESL